MGIGGLRMQDRFKFRYFNKYANKMVEPENWQNVDGIYECIKQQICFDGDIAPLPYDHIGNGLVFMQCTGKKDKNGKLIYEKDIIRFYFDNDGIIAVIEWDNDECCFYLNTTDYFKDKYVTDYEIVKQEEYEVIGNVYQNPELLED